MITMKRFNALFILSFLLILSSFAISPFLEMGALGADQQTVQEKLETALKSGGFEIIGSYHPGSNNDWFVLVYTSKELKDLAIGLDERTGLAAALKIGLIKKNGAWNVFAQNPEYLFHATFRKQMETGIIKSGALSIDAKVKAALKKTSVTLQAYGGDLSISNLHKYHYMFGMPYFTDPVELKSFDSFDAGVQKIRSNLKAGKGNTVSVYEIVDEKKQVAVFGVGLLDPDDGEASFLSIVGPTHLAAMPYEIILEKNEATCLHGRYRFALNWPELTMGTFTKIMSTPGYVSSTLGALTE